jgi:hypothetical protein
MEVNVISATEWLSKDIEERHRYARQLFNVRMQWSRTVLVANAAALGWIAYVQIKPPILAMVHVTVLMLVMNAIDTWALVVAKKQFVKMQDLVHDLVCALNDDADEKPAKVEASIPTEMYASTLFLVRLAVIFASVTWVIGFFEVFLWPAR